MGCDVKRSTCMWGKNPSGLTGFTNEQSPQGGALAGICGPNVSPSFSPGLGCMITNDHCITAICLLQTAHVILDCQLPGMFSQDQCG